VIEEDEYIGEVNGSVGFNTTAYPINPGQSSTFPWAYRIAALYEKYRFEKIEFYYRREVSEYATNGQTGKVMLSCDYDASDAAPTTKQQVLDTEPHEDGMPCKDTIVLRLDCTQMQRQDGCYVRPGAQPANTDIKTYDAGNLYVSTYGNANTSVLGELRVRYRCRLFVPVLESSGSAPGSAGASFEITSVLTGETAAATTVYDAQFATATAPVILSNGIGATIASTGLITLPNGVYRFESSSTSSNNVAAVTALEVTFNTVATAGTDAICSRTLNQTLAQTISSYNSFYAALGPVIIPTTVFGNTFTMQVAATYASGTAVNNSWLKITQL
jgi:hypothetical protein